VHSNGSPSVSVVGRHAALKRKQESAQRGGGRSAPPCKGCHVFGCAAGLAVKWSGGRG